MKDYLHISDAQHKHCKTMFIVNTLVTLAPNMLYWRSQTTIEQEIA